MALGDRKDLQRCIKSTYANYPQARWRGVGGIVGYG